MAMCHTALMVYIVYCNSSRIGIRHHSSEAGTICTNLYKFVLGYIAVPRSRILLKPFYGSSVVRKIKQENLSKYSCAEKTQERSCND